MCLRLLPSSYKQLQVHLNRLASQLFQLIHYCMFCLKPYVILMINGLEESCLGHISLSQKTMPAIINTLDKIFFNSTQQTYKILGSVYIIYPSYSSKKMKILIAYFPTCYQPLPEKKMELHPVRAFVCKIVVNICETILTGVAVQQQD